MTLRSAPAARLAEAAPRRSDAELLADVARGDLTALGLLYDRHHARVRRVLVRCGAEPDVDDLVQVTFLELQKIASAFDGRESCAAWLCGIAVRLASRRRRSIGRMLRTFASFGRTVEHVDAVDPEAEAASRQELQTFASALASLAPKKRDVFVLVEIEGLPTDEVATALGVPAATIRTRLFHARAELRTAMTRVGSW